tara:strand:- start:24290 stop:25564 length:1275 start_codon:yes stop_codon:yes gene_type:complete
MNRRKTTRPSMANRMGSTLETKVSMATATSILALSALLCAMPVKADDVKWTPITDFRLRYENVDQAGTAKKADALTTRLRAGLEVEKGDFTALVEGEGTWALHENYNSTVNGNAAYPVIADPENAEINRLQVQYSGIDKTTITAGRQRINLGNQRFVGSVGWRQNEQTFDAIRVESTILGPVSADITYSWSDRTIFGRDSNIRSISGNSLFATLGTSIDPINLEAFAFLIDQDETGRRQFSSQTYGLCASGKFDLAEDTNLIFATSYARQSDWKNNPNSYDADYWLVDTTLTYKKLGLTAAYEILGADTGAASTSFQTPLATLHKFQGWADKFLTTPASGIRDLNVGASYALGKVGILGPVKLLGAFHQFDSDLGSLDYGHEWDAQIVAKPRQDITIITKYADYTADTFSVDTKKLWIEINYSL